MIAIAFAPASSICNEECPKECNKVAVKLCVKKFQVMLFQESNSDGYNHVYSFMLSVNKTSSGQINSGV